MVWSYSVLVLIWVWNIDNVSYKIKLFLWEFWIILLGIVRLIEFCFFWKFIEGKYFVVWSVIGLI